MRARAGVLLVGLLLCPAVLSQASNVDVDGLVRNERQLPVANAAVQLIAPDSLQQISLQTNASGRFSTSIPASDYRIRVFVPNETGELWHDQVWSLNRSFPYAQPLLLNRTLPYMPRAPTFSPSSNPTLVGNVTSRGGSAIVRVPLVHAADSGTRMVRVEVDLRHRNGTLLSQTDLGVVPLAPRRSEWLNLTLPEGDGDAYYAREQSLVLEFRVVDNATAALYDRIERVDLLVQDECTGARVAVSVRLAGAPARSLCTTADQRDLWRAWAESAVPLQALDATWAARASANATQWDADGALAFWRQYAQATDPLRTPVLDRLDAAQTDGLGNPAWVDLQALRQTLEQNRTRIASLVEPRIREGMDANAAAQNAAQFRAAAFVLGVALLGAGLGAPLAWLLVRSWKRRTEYWIGYSAKGQPGNPLLWVAVAGTAGLVLGLLLFLVIGGTSWLAALQGGA